MPRTKGAIDKRPRKRSTVRRPRPIAAALPRSPEGPLPAPTPEFLRQIDADLGVTEPQLSVGPEPNGSRVPPAPSLSLLESEPPLTREAWEGVLRVPFRVLALAVSAPGVAEVGNKRAKDLARPSYPIFEHYAREYMSLNPDNPLSLAWAATGLVLADIAADVGVEILRARADRAGTPAEIPGGQIVPQAA